MSRQETVLSVFVASPSDVDEERTYLENAIRDLNLAWSRELGLRLELVRWETHAYPGFAEDAQAVINSQIPDDYDIFIGIMWYRFGTETQRAGSGTEEEFNRAKTRYDSDPHSVHLMVYFKDTPAPIAPSKLDYAQLAKVADFRNKLGKEGALYWPFTSVDDFEKLVRLHLTRHVQAWRNQQTSSKSSSVGSLIVISADTSRSDQEDDEFGLLDLMEQFEDEFNALNEITTRITSATEEIGQKMTERAAESKAFQQSSDPKNRAVAKRLINRAASDMEQFVFRMNAEVPLFSKHLNAGMRAMVRAAEIVVDLNIEGEDLEQLNENLLSIRNFRKVMESTIENITDFRDIVASLPRMTTALNRAKRAVASVLQQLIDEFDNAQIMASEAEASFSMMRRSP